MIAVLHPRATIDRQLGRVTMYRLVTTVLGLLVVVMVAFTAAGTFTDPFAVPAQLVTLAVLLTSSYAASRALGLIWRVTPHTESSVITALLLFFLFWPSTDVVDLAWLAGAAVLANVSKFVLAWRGRHMFNPAAAGAFLIVVAQSLAGRETPINATWWVAAEKLLPFVAIGAVLVLWRTRRLDVGLLMVLVAATLEIVGLQHLGQTWGDAGQAAAFSYPIVFIAGFMLSEPLTLPPRRHQQVIVAAATGAALAFPIYVLVFIDSLPDWGVLRPTPELAILVGNLVAFGFARRRGMRLELESSRRLTPETHELTFHSRRPVQFIPGQYAELTVPHLKADARGTRRTFSISSPPGTDGRMAVTMRVPKGSSTFKRALLDLEPGSAVRATGVGGDFIWPSDRSVPLLLVAGGIGITPFVSQLLHEPGRDVVLVYGVASPDEVPFVDELRDVRVELVGPQRPPDMPAGWRFLKAPVLSADLIVRTVPDVGDRVAYVSGPPAMVNAVRHGLAKTCRGIRTDYFTGY